MLQDTYFIEKSSGTFSDNFAAIGLAFVLNAIVEGQAAVRIEDRGHCFAVQCSKPVQDEWVTQRRFFVGMPMLITLSKPPKVKKSKPIKGNPSHATLIAPLHVATDPQTLDDSPDSESEISVDEVPTSSTPEIQLALPSKSLVVKGTNLSAEQMAGMPGVAVNYEEAKQRLNAYWDWRKALNSDDKKRLSKGEIHAPVEPDIDWDIFRAVNPGSLQAYNNALAAWFAGQPVFESLIRTVLTYAASSPNDEAGATAMWNDACKQAGLDKPDAATAAQVLNPAQGKGGNSSKAVFSAPNNLRGFWLRETLKWFGLKHGGLTKSFPNKDRKTYALLPHKLSWNRHVAVMSKFRKAMFAGASAIQLDVLASLRYARAMLEHADERKEHDPLDELYASPGGVSDLVTGMDTAFYKSLGNSPATMNIATLGLPGWVKPKASADLPMLLAALDEHIQVVRSLDEKMGDQYDLLRKYRDFVCANDLGAFFEFSNGYAAHIISQRAREKRVPQFSVSNLEIFMINTQPKLAKLTQSQGFQNLAHAIRMSTVEAQRRSLKKNAGKYGVRYETRYGLGQELTRKAAYPGEFLKAISAFVQSYNSENARVRDRLDKQAGNADSKGLRSDVGTQDVDELLQLMDEFGDSHLVASMLVAYGYASIFQRRPDEYIAEAALPIEDAAETDSTDEDLDEQE